MVYSRSGEKVLASTSLRKGLAADRMNPWTRTPSPCSGTRHTSVSWPRVKCVKLRSRVCWKLAGLPTAISIIKIMCIPSHQDYWLLTCWYAWGSCPSTARPGAGGRWTGALAETSSSQHLSSTLNVKQSFLCYCFIVVAVCTLWNRSSKYIDDWGHLNQSV